MNYPGMCFIAVDGGGTKTEGVLAAADGRIIAYRQAGSSNPNDIGETAACDTLSQLVGGLSAESGNVPLGVFAGISGATGHEAVLAAALRRCVPAAVYLEVKPDVHNLFALSPEPDADCAVLIIGTGSACFSRCGGEIHRIGGWGYLLDSAGGGYVIGRDGLETALRHSDGRQDAPVLYAAACEYLDQPPERSVGKIYKEGKPLIAGFARRVIAAAETDAAAHDIVSRCAAGLAECLAAAVGKGSRTGRLNCTVSGGVAAEPLMRKLLARAVSHFPVSLYYPEVPQLYGAFLSAVRGAGDEPERGAEARFMDGYRNGY